MREEDHDHCACCGNEVGDWKALWSKERHLGVRLRTAKRSAPELENAALNAVVESNLRSFCEGGHRLIIVHRDGCRMAHGVDRCTCGPDIFATQEDAEAAGYPRPH